MATPATPYPPLYTPYQTPAWPQNPVPWSNTSNPVDATVNQRSWTAGQGGALIGQDENLANQYGSQAQGTQDYLNPIEQNLAAGNGGYTPAEAAQINLTPGQQNDIVQSAGITAGAGTAATVGAAERAAAATGGNPAALATYRARAAQTQGGQSADAMTQAKVAAQQAGSAGAQAVGNAQISQQNQGTGYLSNLQAQQNTAAQNEQGLGQGAYGTQAQATGQATGQQVLASELPTIADKLIGTGAGIASSLADGRKGYLDDGVDAVVGEDGPEAIIETASRNPQRMLADGDEIPNSTAQPAMGTLPPQPSWVQRALQSYAQKPQHTAQTAAPWSKATPYSQLGTAIGTVLRPMVAGHKQQAAPVAPPANLTPTSPQGPNPQSAGYLDNSGDDAGTVYAADGLNYLTGSGTGDGNGNGNGSPSTSGQPEDETVDKNGKKLVTTPEENTRNYLSQSMARALGPFAPVDNVSLQAGRAPTPTIANTGGGGSKPPSMTGPPPSMVGPPPVMPVTTNFPPPSTPPPSTPSPATPPPVTTSFPPPAGTGSLVTTGPAKPPMNVVTSFPATAAPPGNTTGTVTYPPGDNGEPMQIVPPSRGTAQGGSANTGRVISYADTGTGQTVDPLPTGTGTGGNPIYEGQPGYIPPDAGAAPVTPPDAGAIPPAVTPDPGTTPDNTSGITYPFDPNGGVQTVDNPGAGLEGPTYPVDTSWESGGGIGEGGGEGGVAEGTSTFGPDINPGAGFETGSDLGGGDEFVADGLVGNMMANGGIHSGFHWTTRAARQPKMPQGGYTPLKFDSKPMMAANGVAKGQWGAAGGTSMANGVKIVDSPTRVKLAPGDQVVPLSFRPRAKVRPSAAMPALMAGPRVRPMFGARG